MTEQPAPYQTPDAPTVEDYRALGRQLQQTDEHYFGCFPDGQACIACADWFAKIESVV